MKQEIFTVKFNKYISSSLVKIAYSNTFSIKKLILIILIIILGSNFKLLINLKVFLPVFQYLNAACCLSDQVNDPLF